MPSKTMVSFLFPSDRTGADMRARRVGGAAAGGRPDRCGYSEAAAMPRPESAPREIIRNVLIVIGVVLTLYLLYLLRRPLGWIVIATFLAIAMSGPVNWLHRRIGRRGPAITLAYIALLLVPVGLAGIVVPPVVTGGNDLANNAPRYAGDVQDFVQRNKTLRGLEDDYGLVTQLENEARKLPQRLGGAAGTLRDLGLGLVNSIFAGVTILVLSVFMVAGGRGWLRRAAALQPPERAAMIDRVVDRMAVAVGNYVAGALAQATVAGVTTFIVLEILGVPFAAPLSVVVFFFDLVPLIGATIAAVIVGLVTVFVNFPTATIVWAIWAVIYQQIENNVIQPQIQKRAVDVHPFVVLVSVLCGSTLFGVPGALLAIPVAASAQIAVAEWWRFRGDQRVSLDPPAAPPPPAPAEG
jgi:predicted PurR-regulated permease PerM